MVNPAVDFFGGIGLGALVGPGGNLLWGMVGKGFNFETWRTNLDSMINSLLPLIKEMEDQNKALVIGDDEIEDLKQKLTEGEDLVEELKKVSSWSLMTPLHTNRLAELDKSIKRLLEILKVQGIRDVKGISLLAKDHTKQLKACKTDVEGTLVLAKDHAEQLKACKRDVEETLVLARDHSDQLTDCKSHVEDTLGLARDHSDQLTDCKSHVEDTLGLARKIDAKLDKFERIGLVQGDEDIFKNNIFFVLVSKKPNLEHIVQQLYRHKEYQVPNDLHLEEIAVLRLQNFLKEPSQNPVLLVLDDVWSDENQKH